MGKKPTRQTLQHAAHPPEKSKREYHQAHDPLELKRAQNELHAHLTFFQNMDRINRALQGTNDLEQVMRDVLDIMLSIFECDRILLVYPCDPDAPSFEAVIERSRPDYQTLGVVSMNQDLAKHFRAIGSSSGPVTFGPAGDYPLEGEARHFRSGIAIALYAKTGKTWVLAMHQCSYPRVWTQDERNLLEEISRRMGDVLTSLLAHRDLQESEERHRVTLQKAMDGFLRADRQGRILEVNEACCRISGYSERELLSMNVADLSPVLTAERIAAIVRGLAETGPNRFEIIGRRKDGSLVDAEVSAQYQPLAGDQVVVFVRDMTTQKRAEEALRDSEERFRGIAGNLPGIVYQYYARDNGQRGMYYVNERAEHVFGVSVDPLNTWYERFEARIVPEDKERWRSSIDEVVRSVGRWDIEVRLIKPTGEEMYVRGISQPRRLRDETVWDGIVVDITDRKRAEKALRRSEAYLAEAQKLSHTGSWGFDVAASKYIYLSEECARIFEWDAQSGLPDRETISRFVHQDDRDRVNREFEKLYREKVDTSTEFRIVLPSGTVRHIQVIRHPVLNDAGDVVQLVGTTMDITEHKRAEEALEAKSRGLQEANTALKVLLEHRDEDRRELEERVVSNVKQLVLPYVELLKKGRLDPSQQVAADFVEANLKQILSPLLNNLRSFHFTPRQLEIIALMKEGRTTKEIAALLQVSKEAIDMQRFLIRKKLGLTKGKANLRSYLLSLA